MKVKGIGELVQSHPFFAGLKEADIELIAGCAKNVRFAAGEAIFREGQAADAFYVIRVGRIGIDVSLPPRGWIRVQTLEAGDVLGWSWLFPPYKWHFSAVALEAVRAFEFNGTCLRGKCEDDNRLGFELMKRFARVMMERLQAARLQILDVYGNPGESR